MVRRGYRAEAERIQELFLAGRRDEAAAAVPDEYLDDGGLFGSPQRIARAAPAVAVVRDHRRSRSTREQDEALDADGRPRRHRATRRAVGPQNRAEVAVSVRSGRA